MLTALQAKPNLRGYSVNLEWSWTGPGGRPSLVLLRRTRAHPQSSNSLLREEDLETDGLVVLDLEQTLGVSDTWAKTQRELCLGRNALAEGNLFLAEFSQYFRSAEPPESGQSLLPVRIDIGYYLNRVYTRLEFTDITVINYAESDSHTWSRIQRWEIYHAPGGGPVARAGEVTIYSGNRDGITADQFHWQPDGLASFIVNFDHLGQQYTEIRLQENIDQDSDEWNRLFYVFDDALQSEEVYYYRLYLKQGSQFYSTKYHWCTEAAAIGDFNFDQKIYDQLPAVHQYYDEPEPAKHGKGQLRRYLSLAGARLNHARGLVELLRDRHKVSKAYSKALPGLARMIGWRPDITSDAILLRKDISDAPDIYHTVGTVSNLRSVVNRVTRWDSKIKEFVHNIFLTNSVEKINLWEIWTQHNDGVSWSTPQRITTTDHIDGHPCVVIDASSNPWLFWHSDRDGMRGLWCMQLNLGTRVARKLVLRTAEERKDENDITEYPAVIVAGDRIWLFFASNRDGQWNVWSSWSHSEQPFSTGPDASESIQITPVNLSDYDADDREPTAIIDSSGNIRVFWQSNRRGPTDIWCRTFDGSNWSTIERITAADFHHTSPAVAIDNAGILWLFYANDQGDRVNIFATLYITDHWTEPFQITSGKHRDESPAAVFWNGEIHLYWHSNRYGRWQLFSQTLNWSGIEPDTIGDPEFVTDEVTKDKDPFVVIDNTSNQFHLFWRSQRGGREYQSRTLDTADPKMMADLRTFRDRAHYTYDTGKDDDDYYARDTVGVFITPNPEYPDLDDRNRRLLDGPLKEFVPINIRPVLFLEPEVYREYIYTYDFPGTGPERLIGEEYSRVSTRVTDEVYTGLDDSYVDIIDDWAWIRTWSNEFTDHRTVDTTTALPIDIHFRTWHAGVSEGV